MATAIPVQQYIGYDWVFPSISLTDAAGIPLNIASWTLAGDLWLTGQSIGQAMVIPATNINVAAASFQFFVSRDITVGVIPQTPAATAYPCRIMVKYTDGAGHVFALRPIFILPLDPRSSTQ